MAIARLYPANPRWLATFGLAVWRSAPLEKRFYLLLQAFTTETARGVFYKISISFR